MATPTLETLARFAATGLLNSLVEGTVIAVVAWAFLWLSGRRDSRTRFLVWFSALLLVVILPWLGAPALNRASGLSRSTASEVTLPASWVPGIFSLWAAGAGLALLRVGVALWQLIRLRWHCHPLTIDQLPSLLRDSVPNNFRGAAVCVSDRVRIPTAVGFFKPLIVIPVWALEELSPSELNSMLIHEFEHLRRWDDWTNLAQKILAAVFFFHPAVWWMDRKLALEREMACDEAVLAQISDRNAYAACLVRVAEKSLLRRGLALAQAVVGRMGQTTLRVTQILRGGGQPAKGVWKPALYLLTAGSLCGVLLLMQAPPLISFQTESASVATAASVAKSVMLPAAQGTSVLKSAVILARDSGQHMATRRRQEVQPKAAYAGRALPTSQPPRMQLPDGFVRSVAFADGTTVHTLLLVVQGEQFDGLEPTFWRICVWHLDAPAWLPLNSEKRAPAKTI
jgi:beta-lactamase regulating signal transducer with metallopeptidase domain